MPDIVHVLSNGRIVKTGGKELALELEARGYAEYQEEAAGVNAEVAPIKTAAETALAQNFAQARGRLPGDDAVAAQREAAFDVFAKEGLPHRRVEEWKYTDLRALMRDAKPLAGPPGSAAARRAAKSRRSLARRYRRPPARLGRRRLRRRNCPMSAELEPGLTVRSLAEALRDGDRRSTAHLGKLAPGSDVAVALNTALDGRRRGDPRRRRRDDRAAAASTVRRVGKPAASFRALAGRGRSGRARHADRKL